MTFPCVLYSPKRSRKEERLSGGGLFCYTLSAFPKDASCPIGGGRMHREWSASTRASEALLPPSVAMLYRGSIFPYLRLARTGHQWLSLKQLHQKLVSQRVKSILHF